jgi:hypothetical protein
LRCAEALPASRHEDWLILERRTLTLLPLLLAVACGRRDRAFSAKSDTGHGPVSGFTRCDAASTVCLTDTLTFAGEVSEPDGELHREWLVFGKAGDSIIVSAFRPNHIDTVSIHLTTNIGQERDSSLNTLWYYRGRLAADGVLRVQLLADNMDGAGIVGDSVPYRFRWAPAFTRLL